MTHVIHYGLPDDTESYTHRSGRTGRAGKTGTSIAIVNLREKGRLREIEKIINKKFVAGEMPTGKQICEKQLIKVIDDIEKVKVNEEEIADFLPDVYRKLDWLDKEDIIKRMVSLEFNRFLEYYRNAPEIETVADRRTRERKEAPKGERKGNRRAEPGYVRLFLNFGKNDNFYAAQIIDLVNRNTRGKKINIGRIDLMKNFSFFEVEEKQAKTVLQALSKAKVDGRKVVAEVASEDQEDEMPRRASSGGHRAEREGKAAQGKSKPAKGKSKAGREERDYAPSRGSKKKDDWRRFFQKDQPFRDDEPDFDEEGWAWRKKK